MTAAGASLPLPGMQRLVRGAPWGGLTPRPYQEWCKYRGIQELKQHRSVLFNIFTGGGKTTIFGEFARIAQGKVLILAERDAILDQAVGRVEMMTGEEVELEQGSSHAWHSRIVVASKDSMKQQHRLDRFRDYGFSLVIVDEAHHVGTAGYQKIINNFPTAKIAGFTATPTPPCKRFFQSLAYEYQLHEAMKDGWSCPIEMGEIHVKSLDLSHIRTSGGDLNKEQLDAVMAVEENILGMMGATFENAEQRQTLVSATSIHNARRSAEVLNRIAGKVVAYAIDSKDERNRAESRAMLEGFKNGDYQFLANVGKATEGFDAPATACIALCRPTLSDVVYKQTIGRGTRGGWRCPVPGKTNLRLLDFVGNRGRHHLASIATVLMPGASRESHEAVARAIKRKPRADVLQFVAEEVEERKKRQAAEIERRRFIVPRVNWEVVKVDPFAITRTTNPSVYMKVPDTSGPPTQVQLDRLLKWKIDVDKNLTKRQAQKLIQVDRQRREAGKSSYAQIKHGLSMGYDVTDAPASRALELFQAIWRNGGRALSREAAGKILFGRREAGEDG